jgi:hypothetical protein
MTALPLAHPERVREGKAAVEPEGYREQMNEFVRGLGVPINPPYVPLHALPLAHPAAPQGAEERLRKALIEARQYVERKSWDAYDDREDKLLVLIDAALAPAAIASGRGEGE